MLDPEFDAEMKRFRKRLVEVFREHERQEHGGQMCRDRLSVVAFFCHSLAIGPEHLAELRSKLEDYAAEHARLHNHERARLHQK